jgi:hypothetical protein
VSAVLADANGLQLRGRLPLTKALENFSFLIQSVVRNKNSDRLTDNLLSLISKEPLCALIPRLNDAVKVLCCDRIAGVLDDGGEFGSGLLRFSLFGHVTENQDNARQRPIGSEDRRTTVVNRDVFSAPSDQDGVVGQSNYAVQAAYLVHGIFDGLPCVLIDNAKHFGERLAPRFIQRPPGQRFRDSVHQRHLAFGICGYHCITYAGECRVKPVFLLLKCPCRATICLTGINNDGPAYQVEAPKQQGSTKCEVVLWRKEKQVRQQRATYEHHERWIQVASQAHDSHSHEVEHVWKALPQDWIQQITNPCCTDQHQQCKRILRRRAAHSRDP